MAIPAGQVASRARCTMRVFNIVRISSRTRYCPYKYLGIRCNAGQSARDSSLACITLREIFRKRGIPGVIKSARYYKAPKSSLLFTCLSDVYKLRACYRWLVDTSRVNGKCRIPQLTSPT